MKQKRTTNLLKRHVEKEHKYKYSKWRWMQLFANA
jgi:hypothetical protein